MARLAAIVSVVFLVVLVSGPAALYLALQEKPLAASILGAVSILLGGHWYLNIITPPRYLGALSLGLGLAALCVVLSRL